MPVFIASAMFSHSHVPNLEIPPQRNTEFPDYTDFCVIYVLNTCRKVSSFEMSWMHYYASAVILLDLEQNNTKHQWTKHICQMYRQMNNQTRQYPTLQHWTDYLFLSVLFFEIKCGVDSELGLVSHKWSVDHCCFHPNMSIRCSSGSTWNIVWSFALWTIAQDQPLKTTVVSWLE